MKTTQLHLVIMLFNALIGIIKVDAQSDIDKFKTWMEGEFYAEFSSISQQTRIPITLSVQEIWKDRYTGEYWFYAEFKEMKKDGYPYHSEVYRAIEKEDIIQFDIFPFYTYDLFIDYDRYALPIEKLDISCLDLKKGVPVAFIKEDEKFIGTCESIPFSMSFTGIASFESIWEISKEGIHKIEKGFCPKGYQITGSPESGNNFVLNPIKTIGNIEK